MSGELQLMGGFFLAVLAATVAAGYVFLSREARGSKANTAALSVRGGNDPVSTREMLADAFRAMGEALPAGKEEEANSVRRQLAAAGYRDPSSVLVFNGIKFAMAVLLGAMMGVAGLANQPDLFASFLALGGGAGFGYLLPDFLLGPIIRARASRIRQAVPAAIDLMVLSVEAGQSLNQAILDTSAELRQAYPDMAAELAQVHFELRAGKSRADALAKLGQRNNEPELRKLANVLIDSDRFGTSLAPALRTHARYLRTRMKQQAQGAARRVAVKLVFPVFFLIFPSVLLVTLGPAVIKMTMQLKAFIGE